MSAFPRVAPRVAAAVATAGLVIVLSTGVHAAVAGSALSTPSTPAAPPPSPSCPGDTSTPDLLCRAGSALGGLPGLPRLPGLVTPPDPARTDPPNPAITNTPAPAPPLTPPPSAPVPLATDAVADFANAAFLQSLLDILAHPLGDRRPDLRHFRLPADLGQAALTAASGGGDVPTRTPVVRGRPTPDGRTLAVQVLVPAAIVVVAVAGRRRIGVRPWLALGGAAATIALAAAATAPATRPAPHAVLLDAMTTRSGGGLGAVHDRLDPPAPAVTPWDQLAAVEVRLAGEQDRLMVLEAGIRMVLGSDVEPVGLDHALTRPSRMARLVAAHEEAAAVYGQCLEGEYALYRRAAGDPQQRQQLRDGAAATGGGAAVEAVGRNLQIVDTQLAQERAIAEAQAVLARLGSPTEAQLRAIAHHQQLIAPEAAPLSQGFGPTDFWLEPPLVYRGSFHPHFHTGIDLAAPLDTPLHAAADGVVLLAASSRDAAGRFVGYGNYVLIGHPDGLATLYGHLDRVLVTEGMVVRQGQVIGLEGSTGWSTGPHVHFEVRYGQEFLDPLPLLTQPAG
ncbi:MAG: Peptidase [Chloroflexi bacterium]|nr:Peptidase [Chloroflexota bacterium]